MRSIHTRRNFLLFIFPITIFYTLFNIFPIFSSFRYSLTNFRGLGLFKFTGFQNYIRLFQDKYFYLSMTNVLKTAVLLLIILIPLSFILALVVNGPGIKNDIYKVIFFSPYVIPGIMSGLIWLFILDPVNGLINISLNSLGLGQFALKWIGGKTLTPYSLSLMGAWSGMGFCMVLWLTGLKGISQDILEASVVDGATKTQQAFYVVVPMLKETFKIIFLFTLTGCLRIFETVFMLTGGGPNHYSETIISYMYTTTFVGRMYGYGMAIAVVEFLLAIVFSLIFLSIQRKEVDV